MGVPQVMATEVLDTVGLECRIPGTTRESRRRQLGFSSWRTWEEIVRNRSLPHSILDHFQRRAYQRHESLSLRLGHLGRKGKPSFAQPNERPLKTHQFPFPASSPNGESHEII